MPTLLPTISGKTTSAFGFGTMQFGQGTPEADCAEIFEACLAAGINLFDTAHGYTGGASETILGKLVASQRDDLLIMTKCAHPGPSDAATLTSQVEMSRTRMNMDVLDVLFLHRWDDATPLEVTFDALAGFKSKGHIRAIGVSNFSAWQVMKAQRVAEDRGLRIDVIQPMYNLVKRQAEVELFPMCLSENIAVTPYSPLAGGLLTGKYGSGGDGRIRQNPEYAARYSEDWTHDTAGALLSYAHKRGDDPAKLAVGWVATSNQSAPGKAPSLSADPLSALAVTISTLIEAFPRLVGSKVITVEKSAKVP